MNCMLSCRGVQRCRVYEKVTEVSNPDTAQKETCVFTSAKCLVVVDSVLSASPQYSSAYVLFRGAEANLGIRS